MGWWRRFSRARWLQEADAPSDGNALESIPSATALPAFLLLYGALYSAYGTESAYMPAFLQSHGLAVERIGLVLAAGTIARIVSGTAIGRLADRLQRRESILTLTAALSGVIDWAYFVSSGFLPLLAVSIAHATATASLAPLSDALSVASSSRGRGFQYGWVRGVGSAAFVLGTLLSGQLIDRFGLSLIIAASSAFFLATSICASRIEASPIDTVSPLQSVTGAFVVLWRIPPYRKLIYVVVLVMGSHALNDAFAVIAWRAGGLRSGTISLLWSESVVAEIATFFLIGPWLIRRLGLGGCAGVSATAGVLRWSIMGVTTWAPALAAVQPLHGLTFALLHMVAMQIIARSVPEALAATAQSLYGAFALGVTSAALTLASGYLYGWWGLQSYWAMAALCVAALPLVSDLRTAISREGEENTTEG